jgi:hypothetical protein
VEVKGFQVKSVHDALLEKSLGPESDTVPLLMFVDVTFYLCFGVSESLVAIIEGVKAQPLAKLFNQHR